MRKDTNKLSADRISFSKAYGAALIWAAFILFLCLLPGEELPDIDFWEINIEDKLAHVGVFAILSVLMVRGAWQSGSLRNSRTKSLVIILLAGIAFGIATEALQGFLMTSRYASLSDALADTIGVIAGVIIALTFFTRGKQPAL